ncbi:MAG TPA: glycine betaine ABC transporter substrate-binding protein [Yaniella sp.]
MKRMNTRRSVLAAAALSMTGLLAGCGLGTAGGYVPSGELAGPVEGVNLEGADISVGSKNFTEQIILGKMAVILFESAGANTEDLTNVPGSNSVRMAMVEGIMDFQWEYTGTAWITYMGEVDPIPDQQEQYEAVRDADLEEHGMVWTKPSDLNNTYAMAVTAENAEAYDLAEMSDIHNVDEADQTFCLDAEFASRNDGFEPMLEHYDLPPAPNDRRSLMDLGAIYQATANGECMFGEVFATDGRIPALDLVVLEDDQYFFPRYNLSGVFHEDIYAEYPQVEDLIDPLTERLDNETMAALNERVDVHGEEPAEVAWNFLVDEGFITED